MRGKLGLLVGILAMVPSLGLAAGTQKRPFVLDRGSVELLIAHGGWRSGLSPDEANPGFSVLGGGGELVLGIDVIPGIGIVASGRVLAGPRLGGAYIEGLGGLGLQVRLSDWVRLRVGIAAGQARQLREARAADTAVLIGGWVAASVDLFRLVRERAAVEVVLRFDAGGHLDVGVTFPKESIALSLGFGFRF